MNNTASKEIVKDTLILSNLYDFKELMNHIQADIDHSIACQHEGISTSLACQIEKNIKDPVDTLLHVNDLLKKQLMRIIDLRIKEYIHSITPKISKASRVKSSNLEYCILLKRDTLNLRSKIRRFVVNINELNLPFNVLFQFASADLYNIAPIEEIII